MTTHTNQNQGMKHYKPVLHKKQEGWIETRDADFQFLSASGKISIAFSLIHKHQVSPASYPKALLKLVLTDKRNLTFQLTNHDELENIRKDITQRLQAARSTSQGPGGKKRSLTEMTDASYDELDSEALAVARSTVIASNPTVRQQHHFLVQESQTVSEEDFWKTHRDLLEEEYARIVGFAKAGTSSLLQSHLPTSGRVSLGVEEMRQIFILYPAVHKAYEEKVPLELSDEQFWRKYLESEYLHRDRGRMGNMAARRKDGKENNGGLTSEQQEARAAAVGTDDLFSRYDQKQQQESENATEAQQRRWGRDLAVGQFDLAKTYETERGKLLEGPRDNHPMSQMDDGRGSRVIQKYLRHSTMVLHPEDAVAGVDLQQVARKSSMDRSNDDDVAKYNGGVDQEMYALVDLANDENDREEEELTVKNIETYYTRQLHSSSDQDNSEETRKRHEVFTKAIKNKMEEMLQSVQMQKVPVLSNDTCFPPPVLGSQLLTALTRKMAQDARTEAASMATLHEIPDTFKQNLQIYFRRCSELLRHFFGLRKLDGQQKKLAKIVSAMENFYREIDQMRRNCPQTDLGQIMSSMCLPIMNQLDEAFQLHRAGDSGAGGFVAVDGEEYE